MFNKTKSPAPARAAEPIPPLPDLPPAYQALVDQALGNPRRLTVGLESQRLSMLLAVLHRQTGSVQIQSAPSQNHAMAHGQ